MRKLIARGADVDVRDRHGNTPLHIACERGYYDCVIALTTPLDHREVKDIPYNLPYQRIPQHPDIKNYNGEFAYVWNKIFFNTRHVKQLDGTSLSEKNFQ